MSETPVEIYFCKSVIFPSFYFFSSLIIQQRCKNNILYEALYSRGDSLIARSSFCQVDYMLESECGCQGDGGQI